MKPNKEIIDLARQLHDLGVRPEPDLWDWYVHDDTLLIALNLGEVSYMNRFREECIVIPDIIWCLEWLRGRFSSTELALGKERCRVWAFSHDTGKYIEVYDPNPHVAVLKAMVEMAKVEK